MARRVGWPTALVALASLALAGCAAGHGGTEPITSPTAGPATTPTHAALAFPQPAIDYFTTIAFGAEYGGSPEIVKWEEDVKIAVHGDPTSTDLSTLDDVVSDLNDLIGTIDVSVVTSNQNVDMYFAPEADFSSLEPSYVPDNMGFFHFLWDGSGRITTSRILISTTGVTQAERSHLIREELTQSFGLAQDSYTYEDSMFYQGWTSTPKYSRYDEMLIQMLYLPAIKPGMDVTQALAVIPLRSGT